jgi:hypothetical protein
MLESLMWVFKGLALVLGLFFLLGLIIFSKLKKLGLLEGSKSPPDSPDPAKTIGGWPDEDARK